MGLNADSGSVGILDEDGEEWGRIRALRGDIGAFQVKERNRCSEP